MATLRIPSTAWLYLHRPGQVDVVPVGLMIRFDPADAFALTLSFSTSRGRVDWTVGRDLVAEAVATGRAGEGDVRFEPHPIWDEWLWLTLESPTGHVVFDVSRADVQAALDGAERHVPSGCERIDWDREWRHLGVAS
jgi:hypothetical protein